MPFVVQNFYIDGANYVIQDIIQNIVWQYDANLQRDKNPNAGVNFRFASISELQSTLPFVRL